MYTYITAYSYSILNPGRLNLIHEDTQAQKQISKRPFSYIFLDGQTNLYWVAQNDLF